MSSTLVPRFPLYVPTKGRASYLITSTYLTEMGVHHYLVVEPQEVETYREAVVKRRIDATVLTLDMTFKETYELCDMHGLSKSTGPGPARNFAWHHSMEAGHTHHWAMDDNIKGFYRLNHNNKVPCKSPALWRAQEDFVLRYKNIAMNGPNYFMFAPKRTELPPFVVNTRIYSCNLIRNDVGFRWRGRYNEDTILSLDMLKAGWCTVQFYAFLQDKMQTQTAKGGNTAEFYHAEGKVVEGEKYARNGTLAKSEMLVRVHPDVSRLKWKFQRVHHEVDYSSFKNQKLLRNDIPVPEGVNNYGMALQQGAEQSTSSFTELAKRLVEGGKP